MQLRRLLSSDASPGSMTGPVDDPGNRKEVKPCVRISVRTLVEFILRSGDIDSRAGRTLDHEAMLLGARVHRKLQKEAGEGYASEQRLSRDTDCGDLVIRVEGRADGIIEGDPPRIDEIKGMYLDVNTLEEPFPVHLAQAKCYAAIYASDLGLKEIGVRMTYVSFETEEIRYFEFRYPCDELEAWYQDLVLRYHKWASWQEEHVRKRNESMQELAFPFPYRKGQQKLAHTVYRSIRDKKDLFLMAPTGVGKTMSCVFPAVRALGEGFGDRIFYLTARNETLNAGREAFSILRNRGLDFRTVLITSKEKICPLSEPSCNPDDCPYAKGHFDRINDAVFDLLVSGEYFDRETIRRVSEDRKVCPFELTLDLSSWCDAVLCDYNYAFDPNVRLKRFFANGGKSDAVFLIDEAHNLVERGREMYSAALVKKHVLSAKKAVGKEYPKLTKALDKLNKLLLAEKHLCEEEPSFESAGRPVRLLQREDLTPLIFAALRVSETLQAFYEECKDGEKKEKLLDFYFEIRDFTLVSDTLDENCEIYTGVDEEEDFFLKILCVNPASRLTECVETGRCAVYFSATLLPVDYYRMLLSLHEDAQAVYAESPFEEKKRLLLIGSDVSTRYTARNSATYRRIAAYIAAVCGAKQGNYMAFFPSYKMMRDVFRIYKKEFDRDGVNWVLQAPGMQEDDREIFLENFYEDPRESLIGFCVMGGMFSEGIDLTGTKLIGAVIVGAGLPMVSGEREILKRHFDSDGAGFDYAYRYPGMNKVQQAAGRVIRTADDLGVIVLLDDRFATTSYRRLFPREWKNAGICTIEDADTQLRKFWKEAEETGDGSVSPDSQGDTEPSPVS